MSTNAELKQRLEALERQERELVFRAFSNAEALALGLRLVALATARSARIALRIRRNDHELFQHAMEGTAPQAMNWVRRKENVVKLFGRSSLHVHTQHALEGVSFDALSGLVPADHAAWGGGFPLNVHGAGVVGAITVSGMSHVEDHDLIVEALRLHLSP
ncbi:heme-degrading domain-containing protein [Roseateles sp.]|uniref:heme-degrading domain-containing protein n=1 Tax=Roseateles sp. TaxID=1971397 RepID=UPI003D0F9D31